MVVVFASKNVEIAPVVDVINLDFSKIKRLNKVCSDD